MFALKDKYVDIFTHFGFTKLFGEEANKDILIDFLNTLLVDEQPKIIDLSLISHEHLSEPSLDRKAIFDLYCENEQGDKLLVELQKSKQNFFKHRNSYSSTFPISERAKRSNWNYKLCAVYTIGILDFVFEEDKQAPDQYFYKIQHDDIKKNAVCYDTPTFIYLVLPKFNKSEHELSSHFDRWMYALKNLSHLQTYPETLQDKIFQKFFAQAELAQMPIEMQKSYEGSLKYYRDLNNVISTAFEDGIKAGYEEARKEGILRKTMEIAHKMRTNGWGDELIAQCTGLTPEQIRTLN